MVKRESGQIIVLLAVALVAILAITALAVDGSMIYSERRDDQTTADSAALAAAQWASASTTCVAGQSQAITKAQQYAIQQEGVTLVSDTTSPNRVEANCSGDNKTLTIKVVVTSNTPTTFAKMISRNQIQTRVEATSKVTFGSGTYAGGAGLWSTGTTCGDNGGIWMSGATKVLITGGGAYSASCIIELAATGGIFANGGPIQYSGKTGNGMRTLIVGDQTEYIGTPWTNGTNGIVFSNNTSAFLLSSQSGIPAETYQLSDGMKQPGLYANPAFAASQWPIYTSTIPTLATIPAMNTSSCSGLTDYGAPVSSTTVYHPGLYTSMNVRPSIAITLDPGVYCIKPGGSVDFGSDNNITATNTIFYFQGAGSFKTSGSSNKIMTMNNSSIYLTNGDFDHEQATFNAQNITIYIKQGSFKMINGAYASILTAPAATCTQGACAAGTAVKGLLVNMDPTNTGSFTIGNGAGGGGAHKLTGTVYVPNAVASFNGGTSTIATSFQLIAKKIVLEGSAQLTMVTNANDLYSSGGIPSVELLK